MPTDSLSKGSFIFYFSQWHGLKNLSNDQLGRLLRAIFEAGINGLTVDFSNDPVLNMAYSFIELQMEIDKKKWLARQTSASKAGKASGESRRRNRTPKSHIEQNERAFDSLSEVKQNERASDPLKERELNDDENEDEYLERNDVGNDAISSNPNNNINYSFWDFYPIFFEFGFANPITVTQDFVNYYESQHWTLKGGRVITSLKDKIRKARAWSPQERWKRDNMEFLSMWALICLQIKKENAPEAIWKEAAYDERIKEEYNLASSILTIHVPTSLVTYIEGSPHCLEILKQFRKDKGLQSIHYNQLKDMSMMKYRLQ